MRLMRQLAKTVLALLIIFDVSLLYKLWQYGPQIIARADEHFVGMIDGPIPYQSVLLAIAIQIAIIAFLWGSKKQMLDNRYDDIKSGRIQPIDGEEAFSRLREKSKDLRNNRA